MKLFGNRRRAAHAAPRQKLPRGTRAAIIAVCVVLALTGGVFAAWKLLVKPVQRPSLSQPDPEPVSEPDEAEPSVIRVTPHETEQPEEEPEPDVPTEQPKALQDGVYNILICGTDDDGTRTDTIIIAHLDANDHTVALLSIPRDTPVATVDLVGGVEFDVPMDMNYEDPSQNLYIHLQKGLQTLDCEQAMGLVRFRKGYATQDIQRTQTQQQFLKALAKQCLSVSSLTKLREFADIFSQYVTTNLTTGNMVWFGKELLSCDFDNMKTYTAEGEGAMINGASYYPLYAGKLLSVVNEAFNPYDTPISAGSLTVITPETAYSYQKQTDPALEIPETPETTEAPDETPDLPAEDPPPPYSPNSRSRTTPSRATCSGKTPILKNRKEANYAQCKRSRRARGKGARRQDGRGHPPHRHHRYLDPRRLFPHLHRYQLHPRQDALRRRRRDHGRSRRADALPRGPSRRHVGAHGLRQSRRPRLHGRGPEVLRPRTPLAGRPSGESFVRPGRKRLTNPRKVVQ